MGQRSPSILDFPIVESTPGIPSQVGTKCLYDNNSDNNLLDSPETAHYQIVIHSRLHIQEPKKYNSYNFRQYHEFICHYKVVH
jgi:hypothetical protein